MTAKDKANILVTKFIKHSKGDRETKPIQSAKECALICVDEIIKTHLHKETIGLGGYNSQNTKEYWEDVRREIEII